MHHGLETPRILILECSSLSLCLMGLLISEKPAALLFADIQPPMIVSTTQLKILPHLHVHCVL
jgi:hypothetical protein